MPDGVAANGLSMISTPGLGFEPKRCVLYKSPAGFFMQGINRSRACRVGTRNRLVRSATPARADTPVSYIKTPIKLIGCQKMTPVSPFV